MNEYLNSEDVCAITVIRGASLKEDLKAEGRYYAECYDAEGNLRWTDEIENTVFSEGKEVVLDIAMANDTTKIGGSFVSLKMGLTTVTGSYLAADVYASHSGWAEPASTFYAARQTPTWTAASGNTKSTASVTFNILSGASTTTVDGCFLAYTSTTTPNDFTGTNKKLLSGGQFSGGQKSVSANDSVIVTYTFGI